MVRIAFAYMSEQDRFHSLYCHGFIRSAICIPELRVADVPYNTEKTIELARATAKNGSALALFPELGLSAYSSDDLFHQDSLLSAVLDGLARLREESRNITTVIIVGAPLRVDNKLFNCAVAVYHGEIVAVAPKTYLPNYREFYEKRQFTEGDAVHLTEIDLLGSRVPFGNNLVLEAPALPGFAVHMEVCEDVWAPVPPSTYAALAGATLLTNLSGSNITIGKAAYRRMLAASQSAKCFAAYLYSGAGPGESTTDLAWDGHAMIYENGTLLSESERFAASGTAIYADIDLDRIIQDRMRNNTFNDSARRHADRIEKIRRIRFDFEAPSGAVTLQRDISRFPYVPADPSARDEHCFEAYSIQVHSLTTRLTAAGIKRVVVGISGGLDSTQALIVCAKTMDALGLPRSNVLAYTMPGFATSDTTLQNARSLMKAMGVTSGEIDIRPSCMQMFKDINHPFARGEEVYDTTFENVQAGERTSHLFRLANLNAALVVGTGDLSELALGWTTYGVGDHMSHYNVNASVPKTLIQYLIRWIIENKQFRDETNDILQSVLATEISPELVPGGSSEGSSKPVQSTQAKIGPYELQDFNLYYISRFGYRPSKVAFMAYHAWHDTAGGVWPVPFPESEKHSYTLPEVRRWLEVFLQRFFGSSQFKRSCVPNSPKVGSGGSLSPRGDWRAPSDSSATVWISELNANVPER